VKGKSNDPSTVPSRDPSEVKSNRCKDTRLQKGACRLQTATIMTLNLQITENISTSRTSRNMHFGKPGMVHYCLLGPPPTESGLASGGGVVLTVVLTPRRQYLLCFPNFTFPPVPTLAQQHTFSLQHTTQQRHEPWRPLIRKLSC
jgi:hypothetical protein